MVKPKTHYEQVPLQEIVKKVAEEDPEERTIEPEEPKKKKKLDQDL